MVLVYLKYQSIAGQKEQEQNEQNRVFHQNADSPDSHYLEGN